MQAIIWSNDNLFTGLDMRHPHSMSKCHTSACAVLTMTIWMAYKRMHLVLQQ